MKNNETANQHIESANTIGHRPRSPNHGGSELTNALLDTWQLGARSTTSPLKCNV